MAAKYPLRKYPLPNFSPANNAQIQKNINQLINNNNYENEIDNFIATYRNVNNKEVKRLHMLSTKPRNNKNLQNLNRNIQMIQHKLFKKHLRLRNEFDKTAKEYSDELNKGKRPTNKITKKFKNLDKALTNYRKHMQSKHKTRAVRARFMQSESTLKNN